MLFNRTISGFYDRNLFAVIVLMFFFIPTRQLTSFKRFFLFFKIENFVNLNLNNLNLIAKLIVFNIRNMGMSIFTLRVDSGLKKY